MSKKISLGIMPLIYPLPVLLVATYDSRGKANIMNAAWGGIAASEPLCLSVGIRPSRHTHDAILERKAFTVNIPSQQMVVAADYVGMFSGRNIDKFSEAGFTPIHGDQVDAPYVSQCPVVLECALTHTLDLQSHTLMIGQVMDTKVDIECLDEHGMPNIYQIAPMLFDSASRRYYAVGGMLAKAFSVGLSKGQ